MKARGLDEGAHQQVDDREDDDNCNKILKNTVELGLKVLIPGV